MKLSTLLMALTALALIFATWSPAFAATMTWDGNPGSNFSANGNWGGGNAPGGNDTARFDGGYVNQPEISGIDSVGRIQVLDPNKNVVITSDGLDNLRVDAVDGSAILMNNATKNLNINGTGTFTQRNNGDSTPLWNVSSGGGSGDLNLNVDDFVIEAGVVLTIQVGGSREVDINSDIANTNAAIIKTSGGMLRFDGTNLQTGATTVNGGTLGGNGSASNSALILNAGGTVTAAGLGDVGSIGFDSADLDGTFLVDINGANIDRLDIDNLLDLTDVTIDFDEISAPIGTGLILATYGSLTGQGTATIVDLPTGYSIDYAFGGNNIALVSAAAIPTPAALPAGLTLLVVTGARRRRR